MLDPDAHENIAEIVEAIVEIGVRALRPLSRSAGRSGAVCRIADLSDDTSVFVKVGSGEAYRRSLQFEYRMSKAVDGSFMLDSLGCASLGDLHVLVMESAERAMWPPPWAPQRVEAMLDMFAEVRSTKPPSMLTWVGGPAAIVADQSGWEAIAHDPGPFIDLGLATNRWVADNIGSLVSIAQRAQLSGSSLVHCDALSDNICFLDDHPRLVDWAFARRGHPNLDLHTWVLSMSSHTGRPYPDLLRDGGVEHLISILGLFAAAPYMPAASEPSGRPDDAAWLHPLLSTLPWVCAAAGIEPPDGPAVID